MHLIYIFAQRAKSSGRSYLAQNWLNGEVLDGILEYLIGMYVFFFTAITKEVWYFKADLQNKQILSKHQMQVYFYLNLGMLCVFFSTVQ